MKHITSPPHLKIKLLGSLAIAVFVAGMTIFKVPCPLLALFGLHCPFCGMTRAVLSLLRLNISAAIHYHFMVFSLPVLYFFFLYDFTPFKKRRANAAVLYTLAAGFFIRWILWFFV